MTALVEYERSKQLVAKVESGDKSRVQVVTMWGPEIRPNPEELAAN